MTCRTLASSAHLTRRFRSFALAATWPIFQVRIPDHTSSRLFADSADRNTEDVRNASSLAAGLLLQYLTTCTACLVLAFQRSWSLTLVILSAVLILMLIHGFSQAFAGGQLAAERSELATAASLVDRAIAAIATVKAFNATRYEYHAYPSFFPA
jgi:ABC-type multidrug transport system fused ATPase/permease subunit